LLTLSRSGKGESTDAVATWTIYDHERKNHKPIKNKEGMTLSLFSELAQGEIPHALILMI